MLLTWLVCGIESAATYLCRAGASVETASRPWQWKTSYEASVLESDLANLPKRIADAQRLVTERLRCLDSISQEEQCALLYAHNVLCDLCKMAGLPEKGFSLEGSGMTSESL